MIFLHDQALREYGGIQGIKDEGLLQSSLSRPLKRFAYVGFETLDLFDLAASTCYGIAKNHPFNDGNKRTAWSCCVLFLKMNGIELTVPPQDVVENVLQLVTGRLDEQGFATWLRSSSKSAHRSSQPKE